MLKLFLTFTSALFLTSCMSDTWRQKKYTAAVAQNAYPMSFIEDGQLNGFEVELLNKIAEELEISIELKAVHRQWAADEVFDGDAHISAGALIHSDKLKPFHLLSTPIFNTGSLFLAKLGNARQYHQFKDINKEELKIAYLSSETINKNVLKNNFPETKAIPMANSLAIQSALNEGSIDLALLSPISAWSFANSPQLRLLPFPVNRQSFCFYFSLDEEEIFEQVQPIIKRWQEDGTLNHMAQKWFINHSIAK